MVGQPGLEDIGDGHSDGISAVSIGGQEGHSEKSTRRGIHVAPAVSR